MLEEFKSLEIRSFGTLDIQKRGALKVSKWKIWNVKNLQFIYL